MHHECVGRMGTRKYLRKNYCHRIECPTANFLTVFMWRRSLNIAALTTVTHRRLEMVFNGTGTQVITQTTNKWRIKIVPNELYNVRDPSWKGGRKIREESTVAI